MITMFQFSVPPPLALYIHVPWCVRKCPYCDFNSHEMKGDIPEAAYIDALLADLEQELPAVWGRPLVSVFIGGGTPSLLSPEAVDRLLSGVRARLRLPPDAEITLEANPGTVETGRFSEFRAAGINRLSIGVQSFDDDLLQGLGRIHGRREAIRAAEAAHGAGFDNFNLDLMFGLPGQSLAQGREDVATAIALEPAHVSYYQLTLEPNTAFGYRPPVLPDEELIIQMHQAGQAQLAAIGYAQYEVSAYARAGRQCSHNLNYWQYGDYLGIGAGAHGKVTDAVAGRIERYAKMRHPRDYLTGTERVHSRSVVARSEVGFEFMMNALRLREGFATELFTQRTGLALTAVTRPLEDAERRGLIEWTPQRVCPTERGYDFLNDLLQMFLPDHE
jgi:putative oxygen-independent coproporphyrinogen III oxidase